MVDVIMYGESKVTPIIRPKTSLIREQVVPSHLALDKEPTGT